jgi:acetyl-CoA acyltransferase
MQKNVVIAGFARSPFDFAHKGALAKVRPDDLAAQVVEALVARTGVPAEDVEDVIVGCAFPEGEQGMNVARLIGRLAHLPITTAGTTVNRFCGSSMQAIHMAAGAIQLDAGEAFVCAGVESMTRVQIGGFNFLPTPRLVEDYPQAYMSMGETAENVARKYQITRDDQDAFAVRSHEKAAAARSEGRFRDEIVPIRRNGEAIEADGCIRAGTTKEVLGGLKLAFDEHGTVTAGTSSPLTDGAAAVLVCTEDYAEKHGLDALARIRSVAVAGCEASIMGIGPVLRSTTSRWSS